MAGWFQRQEDYLVLTLYVQPGAKKSEISGLHGDALKVRLAAPPIEGRANKALLAYIAKLFSVPPSHTELKRGGKSRFKQVIVYGSAVDPETLNGL